MLIPVELPAVEDEPTPEMVVAAILESWSIEEVRQLIEEFEAEIPPNVASACPSIPSRTLLASTAPNALTAPSWVRPQCR
jgi:hypothetical protein